MKILEVQATNFSSYKDLKFTFDAQGLTLLSGPTGAGKSTLFDVIPWCLYGKTAKNGAADDVRTWGLKATTRATVLLTIGTDTFTITRTRAPNDLSYTKNDGPSVRGKDLPDTQRRVNAILGADADLFLAASYYHEFSQTASFFTANAKTRRSITENLVDLSLATQLTEAAAVAKKEFKALHADEKQELSTLRSLQEMTEKSVKAEADKRKRWDVTQKERIERAKAAHDSFESEREKRVYKLVYDHEMEASSLKEDIADLTAEIKDSAYFEAKLANLANRREALPSDVCKECGRKGDNHKEHMVNKEEAAINLERSQNDQRKAVLKSSEARLAKHLASTSAIDAEVNRVNTYQDQVDELKAEKNPYTLTYIEAAENVEKLKQQVSQAQLALDDTLEHLSDIDLLNDVISEFRGKLIANTVKAIETSTNKLLTDHFDAELRVSFNMEAADTLEVTILKDGNEASYAQLSKGQRQMLRLTFGVSVMRAIAQHHSVSFNCIFLDEPTDGLDSDLKEKSFGLLQQLALDYSSVLVVEHNEALKSMFVNAYQVALVNGESVIEKA